MYVVCSGQAKVGRQKWASKVGKQSGRAYLACPFFFAGIVSSPVLSRLPFAALSQGWPGAFPLTHPKHPGFPFAFFGARGGTSEQARAELGYYICMSAVCLQTFVVHYNVPRTGRRSVTDRELGKGVTSYL
jgi:hypothetical protein